MEAFGRVLYQTIMLCIYLFKLDSLNVKKPLFVESVEEPKLPLLHDRVVFLCDLVTLRQVRVKVVFPIESDPLLTHHALESSYRFVSEEKAFLVEDWKHTWQSYVYEISHCVRRCQLGT